MNCQKCSTSNPPAARFCSVCGTGLTRPALTSTAPPHSSTADGKIAAVVIWAACILGILLVLGSWTTHSQSCVAGGSCGPFWTKLMFLASILGFGLGGRLWSRR